MPFSQGWRPAPELHFSPATGAVPPCSRTQVHITCPGTHAGSHRFLIEVSSGSNGTLKHILEAHATVVEPCLVLEQRTLELGQLYVGVPLARRLQLRNDGLLPCSFQWSVLAEAAGNFGHLVLFG